MNDKPLETARMVAICVPDNAGRLAGKRISMRRWPDVLRAGLSMPDFHLVTGIENVPFGNLEVTGDHTGFHNGTLKPLADTLFRSSAEPETAFVIAEALGKDGLPFEEAPRQMLKRQAERLKERGFGMRCAVELEFYLFRTSYAEAWAGGYSGLEPFHHYHGDNDILLSGFAEPFLEKLRALVAEAGLADETTQGEGGPGQYEITLAPHAPLMAADHSTIFKHLTKALAYREGLAASFMAKINERWAGSSGHIHLQLIDLEDQAIHGEEDGLSEFGAQFLAGLLRYAPDFTLMHAPYRNSYQRLQPGNFAPVNCSWAFDNRTTLIRVVGRGEHLRLEFRLPGADVNPYHALAAIIAAGLAGLEQCLEPVRPVSGHAERQNNPLPPLPSDLTVAIDAFSQSSVAEQALTVPVHRHLIALAKQERAAGLRTVTDWDLKRGFERA